MMGFRCLSNKSMCGYMGDVLRECKTKLRLKVKYDETLHVITISGTGSYKVKGWNVKIQERRRN